MVEKACRTKTSASRATTEPQWEVFVRRTPDDPLRHVGAIAAPSPAVAHEEASKLFAWYARDVWIGPADSIHRFSTETLGSDPGSESDESDAVTDREAIGRASDGTEGSVSPEPRVYEESEGTPNAGRKGVETREVREAPEGNRDTELPDASDEHE